MIDEKQAIQIASDYYVGISGQRPLITPAEIELDEAGKLWMITLGISDPYALPHLKTTNYRVFTIDRATGQIKSMKIRTLP